MRVGWCGMTCTTPSSPATSASSQWPGTHEGRSGCAWASMAAPTVSTDLRVPAWGGTQPHSCMALGQLLCRCQSRSLALAHAKTLFQFEHSAVIRDDINLP